MSERSQRIAAVLGAALALSILAGCGEKEEPATTGPVVEQTTTATDSTGPTTTTEQPELSDEQLVRQAAIEFLSSADPAVCETGITEALLRSAYGDRAGCLAARKPQSLAKSAALTEIRLTGGTASMTADATGGTYGSSQTLKLSLVDEGGTWRVDEARSNVPVGP